MIFASRKKMTVIGMAVQTDSISLAKLKQIKKKCILEAMAVIPLTAWQSALKKWVLEHQALACSAVLALPASHVIHKRIQVPACLNDLECEAEIAANLRHYLPAIDEPLHFDFLSMKQIGQERELHLMAARSRYMSVYHDAAQVAGLAIKSVDVDAYAIASAVNWLLPSTSFCAILHIDGVTAQFILLKKGKVFFIYPLLLENEKDLLWQPISRALRLLSSAASIDPIKTILLVGEGEQVACLKDTLNAEYDVRVDFIDSLGNKIEILPQQGTISAYLAALGSALRGCQYAIH